MRYVKIILTGRYRETGAQAGGVTALAKRGFRYDRLLIRVETILKQPRVTTVLLEYRDDFRPSLFAGLEEIREQIMRLRSAGKEVVFFSAACDAYALYLASACSRRILHPLGSLSFLGFARTLIFFRGAMEQLGVEAQILRRGRYKSAGDRFRTDRIDPFDEEQYRRYYDQLQLHAEEKIAEGFGVAREVLTPLSEGRILDAKSALEQGWADGLSTLWDLEEGWKREGALKKKRLRRPGRSYGRGAKRIAVLFFEGAVVDGKTRRHPLLGEAVGSETFTAEVEKLRKARRVKGVVLRINSGGGSATASEDVLSALRRLAKEKPLVISMSEAAGSGGYWIACTGERLFVRETSLTGSIGVLVMLLSARTLLERLGITGSVIKSAEHADMGSVLRPPTETERKAVDTLVEAVYRDFISRVAGARALQRPRVERLAEGRIWSGRDAVARGLADETGGVTEAVDYLRRRLGLRRATVRFYPDTRPGLLQRIVLRRPGSAEQLLGAVSSAEEAAALNAAPLAVMPHSLLDIPRGR